LPTWPGVWPNRRPSHSVQQLVDFGELIRTGVTNSPVGAALFALTDQYRAASGSCMRMPLRKFKSPGPMMLTHRAAPASRSYAQSHKKSPLARNSNPVLDALSATPEASVTRPTDPPSSLTPLFRGPKTAFALGQFSIATTLPGIGKRALPMASCLISATRLN